MLIAFKNVNAIFYSSKIQYFFKALKSKDLMTFVFFLYDVSLTMSRLSLQLQAPECTIGEIYESMQAKITLLERYKTK